MIVLLLILVPSALLILLMAGLARAAGREMPRPPGRDRDA